MIHHIRRNSIISHNQHGFVTSKSCATNLIETLDILTLVLANNHNCVIIFLDFAKAFDKVCHSYLPTKLESFGFTSDLINWNMAFLSNRRQCVQLGDTSSKLPVDWSHKWKMSFNEKKCKVMHFNKRPTNILNTAFPSENDMENAPFTMNNVSGMSHNLKETTVEFDLGYR